MGANFVDYMVTDRVVASHEVRTQMHENTVTLPHCHLITDDTQTIARSEPKRLEEGLPTNGFLFCSFTGGQKIDPVIFGSWMRILSNVPESILWLKVSRSEAATRLRREAAKRGVAEERLVFAKFAAEEIQPPVATKPGRSVSGHANLRRPYDRHRCPLGGRAQIDLSGRYTGFPHRRQYPHSYRHAGTYHAGSRDLREDGHPTGNKST